MVVMFLLNDIVFTECTILFQSITFKLIIFFVIFDFFVVNWWGFVGFINVINIVNVDFVIHVLMVNLFLHRISNMIE